MSRERDPRVRVLFEGLVHDALDPPEYIYTYPLHEVNGQMRLWRKGGRDAWLENTPQRKPAWMELYSEDWEYSDQPLTCLQCIVEASCACVTP